MNLKALSLAAGLVALTLTATSFAANAQNDLSTPRLEGQMQLKEWKKGAKFEKLGLTEAQRNQIAEINKQGRSEIINNVLTSEQRTQLESLNPGEKKGRGFRQLNLTDAQKNQIKQIMESKKQQINGILTPEQRQKLEEMKQNRRSNRRPSANQTSNS